MKKRRRVRALTTVPSHVTLRSVGQLTHYRVIPTPGEEEAEPQYGCYKPTTTSEVENLFHVGGDDTVTYDHVLFTADGSNEVAGTPTVAGCYINAVNAAPFHDITFDHCVFQTLPAGYNGNAWKLNTYWSSGTSDRQCDVYNLTFDHCWFEPQPRIQVEMNLFGCFGYNWTFNRCTFEPTLCEHLSISIAQNNNGTFGSPYGLNVDGAGTYRGLENITVSNCDFQGTGVVVNSYDSNSWLSALEFAGLWPNPDNESEGISHFTNNRVGRMPYKVGGYSGAWFNNSYGSCRGMVIDGNLFDMTYNPGGVNPSQAYLFSSGAQNMNGTVFKNNHWILEAGNSVPYYICASGFSGSGCTFENDHWYKPSGSMGGGNFAPFTSATYTDCIIDMPFSVSISGTDSGCTFPQGHTHV